MNHWAAHLAITALLTIKLETHNKLKQPPQPPYQNRETWYEFALRRFNSENVDYGSWLEQRRKAFIESAIKNPYFDYSLVATASLLFVLLAYWKLWMDDRRKMFVTAEIMTAILNKHQYSRETARLAIEKYNRHIELCNRAIEAGSVGDAHMGSGSESTTLRAELERVAADHPTAARDTDMAMEELAQKSAVIAHIALRIDALSN